MRKINVCITIYAKRKYQQEEIIMNTQDKIIELREATGMNRKVFCEYFKIPYRTVTDWELGNRHCPEYVLRLLEYYIQMNDLAKKEEGVTNAKE